MGQKVNPHGLRVGVIKDWDSRWFVRDDVFGDTLVEDYNLRKVLKKKLYDAGIAKIEIERDATKVRIHLHCARPGIVIGKGGAEIEKLRLECEKMINKNRAEKLAVLVNVVEVKQPRQECPAGSREHRCSAREPCFLPPHHEAGYQPCHASGRKRYQGSALRPCRRR